MPQPEYREKQCPQCGETKPLEEFVQRSDRPSGLMSRCRECDNAKSRRYYKQNRERKLAYMAEKAAGKRAAKPPRPLRECAHCHVEYRPVREDQRYCTSECSGRSKAEVDRARWHALSPEEKRARSNHPQARARSRAWKRRRRLGAWAEKLAVWTPTHMPLALPPGPPVVDLCRRCSSPFVSSHGRRYCSPECIHAVANERAYAKQSKTRIASRVWMAGYCRECGGSFITTRTHSAFCSGPCAKRNARRRDKTSRSKRIKEGARREVIDLAVLAKRDAWACHICKRKVTRKTWSHDHLVPLSHGGSHTWDNVALAHQRCNTKRGAHGAAQLLLHG